MNTLSLSLSLSLVAAVAATSLVAWAWFVMARVEDELRTFAGFEGLHFDI